MKNKFKLFVIAFAALCVFAVTACDDKAETPAGGGGTPAITITKQPASLNQEEGNIDGVLTVEASVTNGATLSYQWYSNTENSNTGGTAITDETSASFTIPTTLTEGTYYYFVEVRATGGATPMRSNVAIVTIEPESGDNNFFSITVKNTEEWNSALELIQNGDDNENYVIEISGDIAVPGSTSNTFGNTNNISVTLKGDGKLYLSSQGNLIRLINNQILIIDSVNLILEGLSNGQNGFTQDNNTSILNLDSSLNAKLVFRNGVIRGNKNTGNWGGGIRADRGIVIMEGGIISGNSSYPIGFSSSAGGVFIGALGGRLYMSGGIIYGNSESELSNLASSGSALYVSGTAEYGTICSDDIFTKNGNLSTTHNTIKVINGVLQ